MSTPAANHSGQPSDNGAHDNGAHNNGAHNNGAHDEGAHDEGAQPRSLARDLGTRIGTEVTICGWRRRGLPLAKRPFYTHPQASDARWSNSFDLLFRGVELVTGGQRLHRHSDYLAALAARG